MVYKDTFLVEQDADFQSHILPTTELVDAYERGDEDAQGPDRTMLQIAMEHTKESVWNREVVSILVTLANDMNKTRRLPERPRVYIRFLVEEKLERVCKEWKRAQRRVTDNGGLESWGDVEARLERTRLERGKIIRQRERRAKVRRNVQ